MRFHYIYASVIYIFYVIIYHVINFLLYLCVIVYALVIYKRINLGNLDFAFLVWNVCTKWHHDGSDMSRAPIRKNTVAHIYLSSAESQFKTFHVWWLCYYITSILHYKYHRVDYKIALLRTWFSWVTFTFKIPSILFNACFSSPFDGKSTDLETKLFQHVN